MPRTETADGPRHLSARPAVARPHGTPARPPAPAGPARPPVLAGPARQPALAGSADRGARTAILAVLAVLLAQPALARDDRPDDGDPAARALIEARLSARTGDQDAPRGHTRRHTRRDGEALPDEETLPGNVTLPGEETLPGGETLAGGGDHGAATAMGTPSPATPFPGLADLLTAPT
ncbi:MAG: hypothetical protein AAFV86_10440, partial [Pseudomonadota bacterium]